MVPEAAAETCRMVLIVVARHPQIRKDSQLHDGRCKTKISEIDQIIPNHTKSLKCFEVGRLTLLCATSACSSAAEAKQLKCCLKPKCYEVLVKHPEGTRGTNATNAAHQVYSMDLNGPLQFGLVGRPSWPLIVQADQGRRGKSEVDLKKSYDWSLWSLAISRHLPSFFCQVCAQSSCSMFFSFSTWSCRWPRSYRLRQLSFKICQTCTRPAHLHPFASQVDKVKTTERHVHDARSCSTWNLLKSDALGILALQLFNPSWIRIVLFENRHVLAWNSLLFPSRMKR